MARVPLSIVPDVQVQSTPPSDYESIPSSPADFGGLIGGAEKQVSGDLGQAGQNLEQTALMQQQRFNQITGDNAMNEFMDHGERITYGMPGDPTNPGLYNLKGAAALTRGPQVVAALQTERQRIKDGLQNDYQKLQFDEQSRRYFQYKSSEISRHLSSQADVYGKAVNNAGIELAGVHASNAYTSDDALMHSLSDASQFAEKNVGLQYLGPDGTSGTVDPNVLEVEKMKARTNVVKLAVDAAIAANDPVRAKQIVDKFGSLADPITHKALFEATKEAAAQAGVEAAINGTMGRPIGTSSEATPQEHQNNVDRAQRSFAPAKAVYDGLVSRGMDSDKAWAFAGNAVQESGANPKTQPGDMGASHGLFMWRDDRVAEFRRIYGHNPEQGTRGEQLDFVMHELKTSEAGANATIDAAPGIDGKARAVSTAFLRPKDTDAEEPRRATIATTLASLGGSTPASTLVPTSTATVPTHNAIPFGWEQQKMDQARAAARQAFPDDPRRQKQITDGVWSEIEKTNILQAKSQAEAQKALKDAQEGIMNGVVTVAHNDPTKFDPTVLNAKDQAGNYVLTAEQRERTIGFVKSQLAEHGIEDIAPFGSGFTQTYNDILDGKVTDFSEILHRGRPGGELTGLGVNRLKSVFIESRKDMNAHGQAEVERGMLNHVKSSLLFPGATDSGVALPGALRDPAGEDIYNSKFLPAFYWGLNQAIQTNKPEAVRDYLTKENVDKIWQPLRSQSDIARARLAATGQFGPGDVEKPGAPLPPPPATANPRAWNDLMNGPLPVAPNGQVFTHKAWGDALKMLAQDPSEKNIQFFNEWAGPRGYDGAEIVKRLKGEAPSPAGGAFPIAPWTAVGPAGVIP